MPENPSAGVSVVLNSSTLLAAGYGQADLEHQTPATESTVYEVGSITKQFTAEAIMAPVEEGKVGLDVPAGRCLSGLPPTWAGITVRHLLPQQSGLHVWETMPEFSYRREFVGRDGVSYRGEPLRPRIIAPNGGILASAADMARRTIVLESAQFRSRPRSRP